MPLETRNPSAGRRQGFGLEMVVQARSEIEVISLRPDLQERIAVRRLVERFRLSPSTAAAVCEANKWGAR